MLSPNIPHLARSLQTDNQSSPYIAADKLSQMVQPKENITLCHKYFKYLLRTNIIEFTVLSAKRQAKIHLSGSVTGRVDLIIYVIYSLGKA